MARRSKEDAQATKEAILKASVDVFEEYGVAKSSLEQIAKKANVTRGAVYWHFKDKAAIFSELQERLHQDFISMLVEGLGHEVDSPLEQLEKLCQEILVNLIQNPEQEKALRIFFVTCDYRGELEELLQGQCDKKRESMMVFAQYFERAKKKGQIPEHVDPEVLAIGLMCYLTGIATEHMRHPYAIQLEARAACLIKMFFNGVYGAKLCDKTSV